MKKIALLLLFVTMLFSAQNTNLKPITLQLKWEHQFQFAGYYAAKEKGYYKEAGLDVGFRQLSETKDAYADVLQGKAEFGIYTSELLLKYHRGDPVIALAAIFQHSPFAIMVLKNGKINSIQDLKNKKVMFEYGYAELEAYLKRENVRLSQGNIVEHTGNVQALLSGKIDAMSVYITDEPSYLEKHGIKYKLFSPQDADIDFYGDMLYTTQAFAKNNTEVVAKFKKASLRGWEYAMAHPEEIIELILRKYNSSKKTKEALLFEAAQMQKLIKSDTVEIGYLYPWRLNQMLKIYAEIGMTYRKGRQDVNEFIFENYIANLNSNIPYINEREKAYLSNKKEIFVCIDPNWMPIEYISSDGRHEGITSDFMKKLSTKLGVKMTLIPTKTWKESLENAKNRKCDMLALATETVERQSYLTFAAPYFSTPLTLVTKDDKPFFDNPATVFDKPLAAVRDYAFIESLKKKYPNAQIINVKDQAEGLEKVKNGTVYGFIDALSVAGYYTGRGEWRGLKISGKLDENFELGTAVRNDDPLLASIIEKGLKSISDSEKEVIYKRWENAVINEGVDKTIVLGGLGIAALLLLLLYYRNIFLERRIEKEIQKRVLQEQIMTEQAKMAQMGEMLDMVAHQWKQPLATINLSIGELMVADKANELTSELLSISKERITRQVSFLVKMLDDMRNFLNPKQKYILFELDVAVKELLSIVNPMLAGAGIMVETEMEENIEINGVKNLFQNALLGIMVNAKDVLVERKTILPLIKITLKKEDRNITLTIEDNGGGIDKDAIDKIFNYRFTTKGDNGGTGVGLYLVKLIVEEKLHGKIEAYNTHEGACFKMTFA
jgi:ABC-type nitrate/sulfonate/bicarbonate transport system substrate-binding protein/signal transduction histidine kinase